MKNQVIVPSQLVAPAEFTAIFEDKQVYNPKFTYYSFELFKPHRLNFKAGQYLSLAVDSFGNRRSYSMINPPSIDHGVELLVESIAGGLGTTYLENLKFGDQVNFLAPMGTFYVVEPANTQNRKIAKFSNAKKDNSVQIEESLVFVAVGSGIAPFKSMISDLLTDKQDTRSIILYWGLRHVGDLLWQDEFQRLTQQFKNFIFYPVISQAPPKWILSRGRVTDLLDIHKFAANTAFYVCGGKQMVDDVFALLKNKGVAESLLHKENFDL